MDNSVLEDFRCEAEEMFDEAEDGLLNIEKGDDYQKNFNGVFRAFCSLKGAAEMFELKNFRFHMLKLENFLEEHKSADCLEKYKIYYLLSGIDAAKEILHGGEVEFEYLEGENLEKPFVKISKDKRCQPVEGSGEKLCARDLSRQGPLIFVVDDREIICGVLSDILVELGFAVKGFTDPTLLVNQMNEGKVPELILSDINMPQMNGLELLGKVKKVYPEVSFGLISGHITKKVMMDALERGACGFVEKPFDETQVVKLVKNVFKRQNVIKRALKSINYVTYQYHDLDKSLAKGDKNLVRENLKKELEFLLNYKKELKKLS